MIRSISAVRQYNSCVGGQGLIAGANTQLVLSFMGSAGGGFYFVDRTPQADPMMLDGMTGALYEESSSAPRLGVQIQLGRLTGFTRDAVEWLAVGIQSGARAFVRYDRRFFAPFGVCMYVGTTLTSGTYVFKLAGGIWTP